MVDFVAKFIDRILPLKDSKTKIGGWLVGLGGLSELVPGLDLQTILNYIIAHPSKAGLVAIAVGLVHKWAHSMVEGELPSVPKL